MAKNDTDTIDILMDSIDAGKIRIHQVDWTEFCSTCVQIYAHFNGIVRIGIAMHQYLCRLHIIDYRINILDIIMEHQSLYTKELPLTDNGVKIFQQECLNLKYFYQLLKTLTSSDFTVYEYLKQHRSEDIYFSYELTAMLKFMTPDIFFTYAQATYHVIQSDEHLNIVNILMDLSKYHERLITDDIIACSRAFLISENFRLYSIDNFDSPKIPSSIYTDFHSFPRKKRNACFDIYWRLRQQYILEYLSEDNELLLDPTEEDAFNKMVEEESICLQNYELGLELPGFADREGPGAADILQMGKYFLEYVKVMHSKMAERQDNNHITEKADIEHHKHQEDKQKGMHNIDQYLTYCYREKRKSDYENMLSVIHDSQWTDKDRARFALAIYESQDMVPRYKPSSFQEWYRIFCAIFSFKYHSDYDKNKLKPNNATRAIEIYL